MRTRGFRTRARAMAKHCFCPAASCFPFSPTSEESEKYLFSDTSGYDSVLPMSRDKPTAGLSTSLCQEGRGGHLLDTSLGWPKRGSTTTPGAVSQPGPTTRKLPVPGKAGKWEPSTWQRNSRHNPHPQEAAPAPLLKEGTCIQSVLQLLYEAMGIGGLGSCHHLLITAALQPVSNVVPHRTREEHRLLPHRSHLCRGDGSRGRCVKPPWQGSSFPPGLAPLECAPCFLPRISHALRTCFFPPSSCSSSPHPL